MALIEETVRALVVDRHLDGTYLVLTRYGNATIRMLKPTDDLTVGYYYNIKLSVERGFHLASVYTVTQATPA